MFNCIHKEFGCEVKVVIVHLRNGKFFPMVETFKNGKELFNTLTVDNGLEFAGHKKISKQLKGSVYFPIPRKSLAYRTPTDIFIEYLKSIDKFKVALVT